ncbi:MAG: hypothetical protein R3176_12205 [Woeseiaceae bacterium]|nr:hypothetical protein [Woeseiaceae bacterium]
MPVKFIALVLIALFSGSAAAEEHDTRRSAVVLDENVWVAFYDLPSRRFRDIYSAVVAGNRSAAAGDLGVAAAYLAIESDRAHAELVEPLGNAAAELRTLAAGIETATLAEFDRAFARAHWLLAQHFIAEARDARDARNGNATGLYLWAATHHIERTLLWSNERIARDVSRTIDELRDIGGRLQKGATVEAAFREKPVVRAEALLRKVARQVDRPVRLAED